MKLIEMFPGEAENNPVDPKDPKAIRAQFIGTPPAELDTRHPDYEPSGKLMPGEYGHAKPVENPKGPWYFTSDKGFSMLCPPHDIRRDPKDDKYPMLRLYDTDFENLGMGRRDSIRQDQ
jgi:hypothetical protein